ncbi:hypothetical protein QYF61_005706, partial [Mycteria americana]
MGLLWPKCRTLHLALLNSIQLTSAHPSSLSRSLCRAFLPSSRSTLPHNLVDGDSTTSLGSLFQCLITLSGKKFFLISNLNLPWRNLRPFPLVLSLVVVESKKVSPQPPLLQAKQPQLPQPLLTRLLRCPSLDTLQHLNVSLVVGGPKLNTGFEVRPHQCRVQGDNHFPRPAGHAISDTSQDAIGFLGHLRTLLAHIQAAVNQHPQVLFHQVAFQPLFPRPVAFHGVVVAQVQDPTLSLVESHTIGLGPSTQPIRIPLSTLPHELVSSANLLRVHSIPSSRSLIKILNRTGPNTEPWGTPLVTSCQLDLTPFTTMRGRATCRGNAETQTTAFTGCRHFIYEDRHYTTVA